MTLAAADTSSGGVTWPPLVMLADGLSLVFLIFGLFFLFVGAVGLMRLPDAFHRMHAISKCSTLGLTGLLLAAVFHVGTVDIAAKSALTMIFAFVATPVGTHVLAKAALAARQEFWEGTLSNEHAEDEAKGML